MMAFKWNIFPFLCSVKTSENQRLKGDVALVLLNFQKESNISAQFCFRLKYNRKSEMIATSKNETKQLPNQVKSCSSNTAQSKTSEN